MPEESINIFISNIYATAIFTGTFFIIFLFLFGLSRIFIFRAKRGIAKDRAGRSAQNMTQTTKTANLQNFSLYSLRKDINSLKTLIVLGLIFVFTIFFVLMVFLTVHFTTGFKIDGATYLIFAIIFLMSVLTVYIVKARIIDR